MLLSLLDSEKWSKNSFSPCPRVIHNSLLNFAGARPRGPSVGDSGQERRQEIADSCQYYSVPSLNLPHSNPCPAPNTLHRLTGTGGHPLISGAQMWPQTTCGSSQTTVTTLFAVAIKGLTSPECLLTEALTGIGQKKQLRGKTVRTLICKCWSERIK